MEQFGSIMIKTKHTRKKVGLKMHQYELEYQLDVDVM